MTRTKYCSGLCYPRGVCYPPKQRVPHPIRPTLFATRTARPLFVVPFLQQETARSLPQAAAASGLSCLGGDEKGVCASVVFELNVMRIQWHTYMREGFVNTLKASTLFRVIRMAPYTTGDSYHCNTASKVVVCSLYVGDLDRENSYCLSA